MKIDVDVATLCAKNYDERAFLEEERKGERTHQLPQIIKPSKAYSSWHPKKFVRVDDQSHCLFIKASRVEKFLGLQEDH
jgi:hypothetical protein